MFTKLGLLVGMLTIFAIMLADFFDTMGTATAIAEQAGLAKPDGRCRASAACCWSTASPPSPVAPPGISSNTTYIESAAGVADGGRTGFTSIVIGVLFLFMILLSPLSRSSRRRRRRRS